MDPASFAALHNRKFYLLSLFSDWTEIPDLPQFDMGYVWLRFDFDLRAWLHLDLQRKKIEFKFKNNIGAMNLNYKQEIDTADLRYSPHDYFIYIYIY